MSTPLTEFSRMNGLEAMSGIYVVYITNKGWCRYTSHIFASDGYWSKKGRHAAVAIGTRTLANRLKKSQSIESMKVLDLLSLKTWTPTEFIAEFGSKSPVQAKRPKAPCPRCTKVISVLKSGKNAKHWCWCRKCYNRGVDKKCIAGCPNESLMHTYEYV